MKTIKSKIMDVFKEISKDNLRPFNERKLAKEYLGSIVINYRRKDNNKLLMKVYKSKLKKGSEVYIDDKAYLLTVINDVSIIYNEYGHAVSITYADGYEWTGDSFVSEDAIIEENKFRIKYQDFIKEMKNSRDLLKIYNDSLELLKLLSNTTCIGDTTKIYNNLNSISNYLDRCLHGNMDEYFNNSLNNLKNINNSLEKYCNNENEIENALNSLNKYYKWVLDLEKVNKDRLSNQDQFFKLIAETKNHINKLFKKMTISQNDWNLLEYYHDELEKMLEINENLTTNFSPKNRNTNVEIEYVDLNEDLKPKEEKEEKTKSLFKKLTIDEKADYLTFKTLRKYGTDNYQFDAKKVKVKDVKKELKELNKMQNKYEKLINKDQNSKIDNVSYATYNVVKSAKNDLENSGILEEKSSDEIFMNTLRNNYDRSVYLKRQNELKKSASKISKIKDILGNMSDDNFEKIKKNYLKVKRRTIGLGTGIFASILAITSFGAYKNYQNNLKNNAVIYESNDISIYGNENQSIKVNNEEVIFENAIEGLGAEKNIEQQVTTIESEVSELETEVMSESIEINTEANSELEQTIVEPSDAIIEYLYEVPVETSNDETLVVENESGDLKTVKDKEKLLKKYKKELNYLKELLPKSDMKLDNVRNIGDVVNITSDAVLQNDEYSLIKDSEGHQSIHKDTLPRVICSVIMSDGYSGITAKTMEEVNNLLEQGYYVAGYGVLNPYSKNVNNLEGFFESDDIVGLVRK